jgi:hypothetical protein
MSNLASKGRQLLWNFLATLVEDDLENDGTRRKWPVPRGTTNHLSPRGRA